MFFIFKTIQPVHMTHLPATQFSDSLRNSPLFDIIFIIIHFRTIIIPKINSTSYHQQDNSSHTRPYPFGNLRRINDPMQCLFKIVTCLIAFSRFLSSSFIYNLLYFIRYIFIIGPHPW